ncbi:MAG: HAD-IIIA family hydrolase [Chlamydiia bacterium]|nr:HAD-IIIA family hydrolase [Chlamydiia bacterium]
MKETLSSYRLLIFDWDGTLIDSPARIINCLQQACREAGCMIPTREAIRGIIGLSFGPAYDVLLPGTDETTRNAVSERYRDLFFHLDDTPMPLFEGVLEHLHHLRDLGYFIAIATGKSRSGLNHVLHELGMTKFFHSTRCADETAAKPNPLMLHEILDELNIDLREAVMVGDSSYDLEMALNAGMDSIAVTSGAHDAEHLAQFKPVAMHSVVTDFLPTPPNYAQSRQRP